MNNQEPITMIQPLPSIKSLFPSLCNTIFINQDTKLEKKNHFIQIPDTIKRVNVMKFSTYIPIKKSNKTLKYASKLLRTHVRRKMDRKGR